MRRRMIATAVLAPAAALASVIPATTAHAAPVKSNTVRVVYPGGGAVPLHALRSSTQSCAGTVIGRVPLKAAGKAVAELDVYATAKNGGTIIACTKHVGATRGVRLETGAAVAGAPTVTSKKGVAVGATGKFMSYAGPAAIGGVKGKYFAASASIVYKGKLISVTTKPVLFPAK